MPASGAIATRSSTQIQLPCSSRSPAKPPTPSPRSVGQGKRFQDDRHLQRGGFDDHAGIRGHDLHPCRAGDRRSFDQSLHRTTHSPVSVCVISGVTPGAVTAEQAKDAVQELTRIPGKLEHLLTHEEECEHLAKEYVRAQDFLFLGRGIHYPIALEGALKLKEVSYIHAEGYPAGE